MAASSSKKYDEQEIATARRECQQAMRDLRKVKNGRLILLFWISALFLVWPGGAITSLLFLPVHGAVPDWYTGLGGWLLRLFLLVIWVIVCLLVWKREKYRNDIEKAEVEVAKAKDEYHKRRDNPKTAKVL